MRVLVCGGRHYANRQNVYNTLDEIAGITEEKPLPLDFTLIHGGATGADALADDWGVINWVLIREFKADWKRYGRAAGPIRNKQMLDEGKPDIVIAFLGGEGTRGMIALARAAGVPIREIPEPTP